MPIGEDGDRKQHAAHAARCSRRASFECRGARCATAKGRRLQAQEAMGLAVLPGTGGASGEHEVGLAWRDALPQASAPRASATRYWG
jgi:hypothetical protein